jgi:cell division septal protein FtsQ
MKKELSIEERLEIVERNQKHTAMIIILLLFGGLCVFLGGFLVYVIMKPL